MLSPSSHVYLFFGEDDFSLRQKVKVWSIEFAKKYSATSVVSINGKDMPELELAKKLEEILTPSLFSSKKLIIAQDCLPTKSAQETLIATLKRVLGVIPSDYFLVFVQNSIDRRLAFNKELAKQLNVQEFQMPHGTELNLWIRKQALIMGVTMDTEAVEKLAVLSGRDLFEEKKAGGRVIERREFFDLYEVHSQLLKLSSRGNHIRAADVGELVVPKVSENVFALSDAVVAQNKKAALEVLEGLMDNENSDEKSMAIKLLGLLSEQIRSLLVVNTLRKSDMDQNQIADFLGWSAGRVFITLKNSAHINEAKLKQLMARLLQADVIVKSSDSNPKLLMDLLIV